MASVGAPVGFRFLLQRVWPSELRSQHNDLIGWHLSVLGTTYAVMMGFMLYAVWGNFETAQANADAEASSLVNMVRSSRGLQLRPAPRLSLQIRPYIITSKPANGSDPEQHLVIACQRPSWQRPSF